MRETKGHGGDVFGEETGDERWEMFANRTVEVAGGGVGDWCEGETWELVDGLS